MTVVNNQGDQASDPQQHTCADTGDFAALQTALVEHYEATRLLGKVILTTDVDVDTLYPAYLSGFATPEMVQHHTCNACRSFIKNFGNLVVVSTDSSLGVITPLMWPATQKHLEAVYQKPIKNLYSLVKKAKVNGVHYSSEANWGTAGNRDFLTGDWWNHFHVQNRNIWTNRVMTDRQAMAAKREDYKNILNAFADPKFAPKHLATALQLLEGDALYRQERHIGGTRWLKGLQDARAKLREPYKSAYTWAMIAQAPDGFLHPRSGMLGTLVEGIAEGKDFGTIKREFAAKMDPMKYQRPQAAPAAGTLKRADDLVRKLGMERSFQRRPATFQDIRTVWIPTLTEENPYAGKKPAAIGGIFGHVQPKTYTAAPLKRSTRMNIGQQTMSWNKFQSTVLASAERIEVQVMPLNNPIAGFLTAVHMDAPPILAWDYPEDRNPASWYIYQGGSAPASWNIKAGWVNCIGVALRPNMWNPERPQPHQGTGGVFLLEGAYDANNPGACLFPEILISELREVRSVVEGYSQSTRIPNAKKGNVAGMVFGTTPVRIRVTTKTTVGEITIDRWE